jgi:hypothetical protein
LIFLPESKNIMRKIQLFAALTKVDETKREVWGLATAEVVDKEGEIFDYASSKPYFEGWSREISDATSGRSLGNVREMHQSSAVGKLVDLQFDDQRKTIAVGAKIVDEAAWQKCVEGVYTGFSIGGRYVNLWPDGEFLRFTAQPVEISVVDNPAVPNAHFTAIKADESSEVRKFVTSFEAKGEKEQGMKPEQEEKLERVLLDQRVQQSISVSVYARIPERAACVSGGIHERSRRSAAGGDRRLCLRVSAAYAHRRGCQFGKWSSDDQFLERNVASECADDSGAVHAESVGVKVGSPVTV